jgi:large subunit ribosomal protein L29
MAAGLTAPELRELSVEELATRLRESKEELFNLRFQVGLSVAPSEGVA